MAGKELQLVAVGNVNATLVRDFEEPIRSVLNVEVACGKATLTKPQYAFNKDRNQYHCNAIMRRLLTLREPGSLLVLGVVDVDLFVPDAPFVYGEADRESRSGVFSVFRLTTQNPELTRRRLTTEAVHRAGQLIGLSYCEDARCTMFFATSITDCDRRNLALCSNCRNELHKLRR